MVFSRLLSTSDIVPRLQKGRHKVFHPVSGTRTAFNAKNMIVVVFLKYHSSREYVMTKAPTNLVAVGILD